MAKKVHISHGLNANQMSDLVPLGGLQMTKSAPPMRYHSCNSKPSISRISSKNSITMREKRSGPSKSPCSTPLVERQGDDDQNAVL